MRLVTGLGLSDFGTAERSGGLTHDSEIDMARAKAPASPTSSASTSSASPSEAKAAEIQQKAIQYNPKLDPKYDARAFSDVKVHTGSSASATNSSLHAQAYTSGNSIKFRDPRVGKGKSLIGHELTHVVQQGGGLAKN